MGEQLQSALAYCSRLSQLLALLLLALVLWPRSAHAFGTGAGDAFGSAVRATLEDEASASASRDEPGGNAGADLGPYVAQEPIEPTPRCLRASS